MVDNWTVDNWAVGDSGDSGGVVDVHVVREDKSPVESEVGIRAVCNDTRSGGRTPHAE